MTFKNSKSNTLLATEFLGKLDSSPTIGKMVGKYNTLGSAVNALPLLHGTKLITKKRLHFKLRERVRRDGSCQPAR
jgi:hypothetical protein